MQLDDHWTRVFTNMADARATQLEKQAQKDQYHATMNWIQDGPVQGLRRQHQFTKVRGGWIPSAMVEAGEASSEDRSSEDGLSLVQLRSALCPPDVIVMQPASIQEETDLEAANWSCEWGGRSSPVLPNLSCQPTWERCRPGCWKMLLSRLGSHSQEGLG